jgi:hydrogenase maturation protein HypF
VVEDLVRGLPAYVISIKFHHTLAEGFAALCGDIAKTHQIDRVALSGGCFQNRLLLESMTEALSEKGLNVFIPRWPRSMMAGSHWGKRLSRQPRCGEMHDNQL